LSGPWNIDFCILEFLFMAKENKRMRKARQAVDAEKFYSLKEACDVLVKTASAKFDETVDMSIVLGVDPRKADQNVRGNTDRFLDQIRNR